jgi:hypothetical protein
MPSAVIRFHDFRLATDSPARGTGYAGLDMGAQPSYGSLLVDTDLDEMPDAWELEHALDPGSAFDRNEDADADGLSNCLEYLCGTDPLQPASVLRFRGVTAGGSVLLEFDAVQDRSYRVEYSSSLKAESWQVLTNMAPRQISGTVQLNDDGATSEQFYRLILEE